jgi:AcrR family transcriptional regulator
MSPSARSGAGRPAKAHRDRSAGANATPPAGRSTRRDFLRNRQALLDAVEALLADQGPRFSMAELASAAVVSTATVYRHFEDSSQALRAYYDQLIQHLSDAFDQVTVTGPLERFDAICAVWVTEAARWGRAAVQIRSAEGYLARLHQEEPRISAIHAALAPVVQDLLTEHLVAVPSVEYGVLLWTTIFDERVIVDLTGTLGWSVDRAARTLRASALGALGHV